MGVVVEKDEGARALKNPVDARRVRHLWRPGGQTERLRIDVGRIVGPPLLRRPRLVRNSPVHRVHYGAFPAGTIKTFGMFFDVFEVTKSDSAPKAPKVGLAVGRTRRSEPLRLGHRASVKLGGLFRTATGFAIGPHGRGAWSRGGLKGGALAGAWYRQPRQEPTHERHRHHPAVKLVAHAKPFIESSTNKSSTR